MKIWIALALVAVLTAVALWQLKHKQDALRGEVRALAISTGRPQ
jgi:hypothetical protein